MDRITAAAEYLYEKRRRQEQIAALPEDLVPRSQAEGHQIQELVVQRRLAAGGGRPIGYKIACTSELAQKALRVSEPFFGILLSHTTQPSPARLRGHDFMVRCAEAEFGFQMATDVPPGVVYTAETIRPYIATVIPAIEIVDHPYLDWKTVGVPSLIADNAIHGAWIEGTPVADWQEIDFTKHPTALIVNDTLNLPGSGAAVLGNPLNVVAWLANALPNFGRQLRAGDKITTGLTTDVYLAAPGDHLVADFGSLGRVELAFEAWR